MDCGSWNKDNFLFLSFLSLLSTVHDWKAANIGLAISSVDDNDVDNNDDVSDVGLTGLGNDLYDNSSYSF